MRSTKSKNRVEGDGIRGKEWPLPGEDSGDEEAGDARVVTHGLDDVERQQLVGAGDAARLERIAAGVVAVDAQAGERRRQTQRRQDGPVEPQRRLRLAQAAHRQQPLHLRRPGHYVQHSTPFYWVLLGFNGFYWVLLVFKGFQRALMGFNGFYWVSVDCNGFYWVSVDCNGFYWVPMGFNGFY